MRREREHWIQAERRHEALIPDDCFERVQAEIHRRHTGQTRPRDAAPQSADPKLRRHVYDAFRLTVEIDRNQARIPPTLAYRFLGIIPLP